MADNDDDTSPHVQVFVQHLPTGDSSEELRCSKYDRYPPQRFSD